MFNIFRRQRRDYDVVFGIGLNKTGTTSLMRAFKTLDFGHKHYDPALIDLHFRGRHQEIFRRIQGYETFEDWPWPLMYKEIYENYGRRAKFILTRRASPSVWVESLKRHAERTGPNVGPRSRIFGHDSPEGREGEFVEYYERHLHEVRQYFSDPRRKGLMIEVCFEEGDGWKEICAHLGKPAPRQRRFPHLNASKSTSTN